ncbi:adaptor protein complex 3 Mu3A [Venturia nashicola]|uniref:Adaptor protein complex 3 Mu3A n=1 Tax=Venturia nashicola TaxID=86259 RepID=A0A4Z1NLJ1_9PEZI|nr:adaptor protein complex 3 Mu3A [Venturia nashicola]
MSAVEALYIFDEHNNCILEHVWNGRPPSAHVLLPLYLSQKAPRPSLIYAPDTNPPSLIYSILQDRLLFLSPSSQDTDPLAQLEFLHRVADILEDFLGSPLLAHKIETSYDVITQLLGEMCDGGIVATTEPNALRDVVEAPSWMNKLLGGVGLPSSSPSLNAGGSSAFSLPRPTLGKNPSNPNNIAIPWRRNNVRHTSNELYVDIIETLHVTFSPSGRPLAAFAHGTIAFTAKVSGVPDLLLILSTPGGSHTIAQTLRLPVFHPCVRLARWKEKPGEMSFVPPDGRFLLAGYEVDLLGPDYLERVVANPKQSSGLSIPASVDVRTGLGPTGSEFEVRLLLDPKFASTGKGLLAARNDAFSKPTGFGGAKQSGTSAHPTVEDVVVKIPITPAVRNLSDLRPSRGEAHYSPGDGAIEWRIAGKDAAVLSSSMHSSGSGVVATLRCTVVGALDDDDEGIGMEVKAETWDYDDNIGGSVKEIHDNDEKTGMDEHEFLQKKIRDNKTLMPGSASVSFQVKGWLASGIKVEKLVIDTGKSKGLGAGVQPYKGVKYLTVSKDGVEARQ